MVWYASIILQPITQAIVIIGFVALFVASAISASKLTEEFNFKDALPRDSYILDFTEAYSKTTSTGLIEPYVYFRYVDFGPDTRVQMRNYLSELANSSIFAGPPRLFWLDFFELSAGSVPDLNFTAQMDHFLSNEMYAYLFARDISRDENGNVVASRVRMRINVDIENAKDQIAAMKTQEAISKAQPINAERQGDLAFFCYDGIFKLWEFLRIAKFELMATTIVSVLAVTLVALVFIPHWSAIVIVFPMVCVLFVDLLGVLQWAGLHINPVSYVSLAMSLGLLVDYIIHIVFRFYEETGNRREKTVSMLRTMGVSILLGGATTWLGTMPLMFSSSDVFETVYVTFLGIVLLGMGHGLILLPVLLSLFGPEIQVSKFDTTKRQTVDAVQTNLPA
jgi:predicted RND superfamily exporter protein